MTDNLDTYIKKWALSAPFFLTETNTSRLYKVVYDDQPAVIKLLNDIGVKDETKGAIALRHFNGSGAVKLLECHERAHLLEFAGDKTLAELVTQGQDEQATGVIASVLNTLHQNRNQVPDDLTPLRERFNSLFERARIDSDDVYKRAAAVAEKLLDTETDKVVLHGDMHHENILESDRGWLAIDPKGLYGERTFDACNVLQNPLNARCVTDEGRYLNTIDILSGKMNLDRQRLLSFSFAFSCLSASWSVDDNQDLSLIHI